MNKNSNPQNFNTPIELTYGFKQTIAHELGCTDQTIKMNLIWSKNSLLTQKIRTGAKELFLVKANKIVKHFNHIIISASTLVFLFFVSCADYADEDLVYDGDAPSTEEIISKKISLDENNLTIRCRDAKIGETATINGKVYTVVNEAQLREMVSNDEDVRYVCTSKITDMSSLFEKKLLFNQNIGSWDTSNVINMEKMFNLAESFNQDIGSWDTSKVNSMKGMFSSTPFNQDIGSWETANVDNMSGMFYSAYTFNQPLENWDTSNVTNMCFMFTLSVFNQNLSSWCVTRISNEPNNFSFFSPLKEKNKPTWGKCSSK